MVAKDVPPYAVFCGTEVKKFRFSETIRNKLIAFDLSRINYNTADQLFDVLYLDLTEENIDGVLAKLSV